ncbi:MAG: hypothetical protein GWP08_16845 [Nitrospiraceae bacterium]|nr:hypothetical protein [Nitrospiraceae bacterium]
MDHRDNLAEAIKNASVEHDGGKVTLACAHAFKLAEDSGVGVREIGAVCNKIGIQIAHCQFGCFD